MKRKMKKLKNMFLKGVTIYAGAMWVLSIFGADSNPKAALIILYITTAWLAYFGWCNGWFDFKPEGASEDDF